MNCEQEVSKKDIGTIIEYTVLFHITKFSAREIIGIVNFSMRLLFTVCKERLTKSS
jgi:hypothetical protein